MDQNSKHTLYLRKHEYYGPLLLSYIDTVLRSGEILEDDFQAILSVFHIEQFETNKKTYIPYWLTASAFSLLPSIIAAKKLGSLFYVVPSAIFTTSFACYYVFGRRRRFKHEIIIDDLVSILKNIQILNKRINKYLVERKNHINECSRYFFQPLSNTVNGFVKNLSKQQSDLHQHLICSICSFSQYCEPLREDCMLLKDFESSTLIDLEKGEIDDSLKYTKDVIDLQQLLSSKLLSYFAIICCWEEAPLSKENLESFINKKIPFMIESLKIHHRKISEIFHSLRRTLMKLSERELEKKSITNSQISGKLGHALDTSLNNLSFVLEKLQNVADNIEKCEGTVDHQKVDQALTDIRNHTADTYEAIDILCKIYGKLSKNEQNHDMPLIVPKLETRDGTASSDLQSKCYSDPLDLIEDKEKYKLYVKASESIDDTQPIYEEPSDTYLRLVIKELKQNLNQHSFYVSAKNRWKDESDEEQSDEDENSSYDDEITVTENPSFLLNSGKTESVLNKMTDTVNSNHYCEIPKDQLVKISRKNELQAGNSDHLGAENGVDKLDTLTRALENEEQSNWNPILQGIKAYSQNIQLQEETFGGDNDSD